VKTILRLYRIGHPRRFRMLLECGHKFVITDDELRRRHLFLGKRIPCPECER
jgi:hypothetical protein